ncbi:hypothetical protein [Methylobacterium sp. SD21]|uniref:hypothetical protein n=1 Tax=Methylobacterium litchii TaxID=3138810 RepID=UPI00313C2DAE
MSAGLYLDTAETLARSCVRRYAERTGLPQDVARDRVAQKFGWAPGTLYNLLRGRLKKLDADLRAGLTRYAIEDLQNEIAALSRELENARGLGAPQDPHMVGKAAALLSEAQALHDRMIGGAA